MLMQWKIQFNNLLAIPQEGMWYLYDYLIEKCKESRIENATLRVCVGSWTEWKRLRSAYNIVLRHASER